MAASDHLHPKQLSMFMPARDLYKMTPSSGDMAVANSTSHDPTQRKNDMWAEKLSESKAKAGTTEGWRAGGLHESIAKSGVQTPVNIEHDSTGSMRIADGHHRIASANDINPDMEIPIQNHVETEPFKVHGQVANYEGDF